MAGQHAARRSLAPDGRAPSPRVAYPCDFGRCTVIRSCSAKMCRSRASTPNPPSGRKIDVCARRRRLPPRLSLSGLSTKQEQEWRVPALEGARVSGLPSMQSRPLSISCKAVSSSWLPRATSNAQNTSNETGSPAISPAPALRPSHLPHMGLGRRLGVKWTKQVCSTC